MEGTLWCGLDASEPRSSSATPWNQNQNRIDSVSRALFPWENGSLEHGVGYLRLNVWGPSKVRVQDWCPDELSFQAQILRDIWHL